MMIINTDSMEERVEEQFEASSQIPGLMGPPKRTVCLLIITLLTQDFSRTIKIQGPNP